MDLSAKTYRLSISCLLALCFGIAPSMAAELKDPLSPLNKTKDAFLCFRRDYAADHLAKHPKQTTKSIVVTFQGNGYVTIALQPRSGAENRIGAGCEWRQGAGIDTSDRKMIPNFNKSAGFDCITTVGDTAEEGGYGLIDPAQDGKSMTVFLQSPIYVEPKGGKGHHLDLGVEDRTFILNRVDAKTCQDYRPVVNE